MIRAVLFDLDGTLLDTAPDLVASLNHVRRAKSLEPVRTEDYRHHVSRGAVGLLTAGLPGVSEEEFQEHKAAFLEHYRQNLFVQTRPFEGVPELLGALDVRGVPWGVVTNKSEALTRPLLGQAGLLNRAACIVCGDTLAYNKPHPAPVRLACEILRLLAEDVLMVGDDARDLEAGTAAGTQTAFAAYGYVMPDQEGLVLDGSYQIARPLDILDLISHLDAEMPVMS